MMLKALKELFGVKHEVVLTNCQVGTLGVIYGSLEYKDQALEATLTAMLVKVNKASQGCCTEMCFFLTKKELRAIKGLLMEYSYEIAERLACASTGEEILIQEAYRMITAIYLIIQRPLNELFL